MKRILLALSIALTMIFTIPQTSLANVGTLVDCDKSPAFTKRLNASVKKLEGRLAKYEANTPPALALQQQIDQTKTRFKRYGDSGLLCGADGLPHLVADGDWGHAPEFVIPGMMFLYTTGWIGWSARKYLQTVATGKDSTQKEIIIDVPAALNIMFSGYLWPAMAWSEFVSGDFVAEPEDITVSPR